MPSNCVLVFCRHTVFYSNFITKEDIINEAQKALLAVLGCVAALAVPAAVMAADDDAIVIGNTKCDRHC